MAYIDFFMIMCYNKPIKVFATEKGKNEHFYKKLKNLVSPCK